jgi:flagellar hook-associated protein 1
VNIDAALSIATGGLANIDRQLNLVAQNVANASTPGYAAETATQQSITANGEGLGVRIGPATRSIDATLQAELFSENATVAGLQMRQTALQTIDAAQGTPGQNSDIGSLLGNLQDQFSTLLNNPDSQAQQTQVVSTASSVSQAINGLSATYTAQRQMAQDNIVTEVAALNAALGTIGSLSDKIVAAKGTGQSTADLENQRDAALGTLSQLVNVKVLGQSNGDLLISTTAGLSLPTHESSNPLSTSGTMVQPATFYPGGGIPAIMLGGSDVTSQLRGGQIGANITLRDTTLPTDQAELDELAQNLASRFAANGLTLFTDPAGVVPAGGGFPVQNSYVGFSGVIQVNAAVQANPSLLRDGTPSISGGLAGFTGIISTVLNTVLGASPALASNTAGLGPAGNLTAPYVSPPTLRQLASTMLAAQAQESALTSSQYATEQAVQTTLTNKMSAESGVNMDTEMTHMIRLQNAYGANARVLAAVQSMWTQLLNSIH